MAAFNPLVALFGQQAASKLDPSLNQDALEAAKFANGIEVQGQVPQLQQPDAPFQVAQPGMPVAEDPVQAPRLSNKQLSQMMGFENIPDKKGMFGVKGTLRDILGTLGDAFLVQSGNKAIYGPQKQQENASDAMAGFIDDPLGAIRRLAQVNPEMAQKIYENYQDRGYQDDVLSLKREAGAADVAKQATANFEKGSRLFGQYAGALAQNPGLAPRLLPVLQKIKEQFGLGDEFTIPGEGDVGMAEAYRYGGTPAQQQLNTEYREQALAQKESQFTRAEKGRMARDNPPPAPRQPRSQTELEYFQQVDKIPPEKRTQGQKDFYKKYTQGTSRGRGSGRQAAPANSGPNPSSGGRKVIRQGGNLFDAETKKYIGPAN